MKYVSCILNKCASNPFVMYWLSFLNELLHNVFAFNRMLIFFYRNNPFPHSTLCGHDVVYCKRPKALRVCGNPFCDARRLTVQVLCLYIMPFVCVLHIFLIINLITHISNEKLTSLNVHIVKCR